MAEDNEKNRISFHSDTSGSNAQRTRHNHYFSLPDGRKAHIAGSPDDLLQVKERLVRIHPEGSFDVYINGSNEHIEALRVVQRHHENRQNVLRREHSGIYTEMEAVRADLDSISRDLRNLSDHGVLLDANFSKYGFAAHLRTYDDNTSTNSSVCKLSRHNTNISDDDTKPSWSLRTPTRSMKFYKKPIVRQYFHKGLLWRGMGMEEVLSFELFVDLLYVGIIAVNGDMAAEHPAGLNLLEFSITFIMAWKLWNDLTLIISWFEIDDILQRIGVLFIISCLFGYTTNITTAFLKDSEGRDNYTQLVAFFFAARVYNGLYFLFQGYMAPIVRGFMFCNAMTTAIPSALWISSIYVDMPYRLGLILVAIGFDVLGDPLLILFIRYAKYISASLGEWNARVFDFYPAINIEHKTERTKQLVTLVFGYSVVALLYQSAASMSINSFYGKAVLGIVQTFCQNWIYFEIDGAQIHVHAIRRHVGSMIVWNMSHLPFIMAEVLSAAALSRLVIATDSPDNNVKDLAAQYLSKSAPEVEEGLRWFYCGGLGTSLLFMSIISLTHIHKKPPVERVRKNYRVAYRVLVSAIIFCLPVARSLNSLQLEAVITSLVVSVLVVDIYGSRNAKVPFFSLENRTKHKYTAHVNTKHSDLENALKTGKLINILDLAEK